ncbi:MAG: DMT family transporter [Peptoniphilaceae bacterium]|nr:DMT family transporter [Peptoniphilaceae bacterium]MDY6019263.1 DMT family transporter [Anaerococcus sp.]
MEKFFTNKKNSILVSIFAMVLWGSAIPLIKLTYQHIDTGIGDTGSKILLAGLRFFLAGLLSFIYYYIIENKAKTKEINEKLNIKTILILALLQTFLQYLFYYIGLSNTEGSKASVIQASNAFFSVIIAVLFIADEFLTKRKVLALILGTVGILIVNFNGLGEFSFSLRGEGFVIMSTLFGALANAFLRKYGKNYNSFSLTASQFVLGSIPLIIIGKITAKQEFAIDGIIILYLLYGAFISATAFSLWSLVLKYNQASEFSIYKLFIPIFGTIFSIIFLKEALTLRLILGLIFVLLGSRILNKK